MKKLAVQFYEGGYNCSQCIVKAFETKYHYPVPKEVYDSLNGVNNGFGIGGFCSGLVAGIMIFGLLFDQDTAKRLRIELLMRFQNEFGNVNCSALGKYKTGYSNCNAIIAGIACIVEDIIQGEKACCCFQ